MSEALDRRLRFATQIAVDAGEMAMRMWPPPGAPVATLKGAQDWLTEADGAIESFLSSSLLQTFPSDGFQGEEEGQARTGKLRWVVDPIDGTSNFARGNMRFAISIGLIEDRTPLLGVVVAPALGETFAAKQGGGATLNGKPIHASATGEMKRAMVEIGWSARRPNAAYYALISRVMDKGAMMRAGGSGTLGLTDVAAGRLDAYLELHINLWDVAGALAILAESGATVSDFMSGDGPTHGAPIVAACPGLSGELANALAAVGVTS